MSANSVAVSVIVPVYKCEKYIESCIESILAQSLKELQLILVDDGSPDRAPLICDEYSKKDDRILVIHQENSGVSAARNAGLNVAEGKYVTFVDSDDYLEPEFLKDSFQAAKEHGADLVASGLTMENWADSKCVSSVSYTFVADKIYDAKTLLEVWGEDYAPICMCGPCCKLYRRSIIEKACIQFPNHLNYGEDTCFNLDFLMQNPKTVVFAKSYYHYRRESGESLFSRFHRDTYEVHAEVYGKKRVVMKQLGCSNKAINAFEADYFYLLLGGIHEYYRFYEESTPKQKKELVAKIANDANVLKLKGKQIPATKNRILLLLMKAGFYRMVCWMFQLHYGKGNGRGIT